MTTNEEEITRSHELYLRHLLLLGQAAPVALKAIIEREVSKRHGENLAQLMSEKKDTFKDNYNLEFLQLFQDDEVSTNIDLWDTLLLCVVTLVLFKPSLTTTELEAITCVSDQRKALGNYAHSVSLNYNAFQTKWDSLQSAMLTLIEYIDSGAKFDCKRMIHSFKSEPIRVNIELINRMKQTNDVDLHVKMAIQDKVSPKIHGEKEDSCNRNDQTDRQYDTPVFTENLQDKIVYSDESAILTCKLNVSDKAVIWQKDSNPVEETDNLMVVSKKEMHWLAISRAKLMDTGRYICVCGNTSTEALLKVTDRPLTITKGLHVATVEADIREKMDIMLKCAVNLHTNKVIWRHDGIVIKPSNRHVVSVQDLEHNLTIMNVTFEDEGDYTVDFGEVITSANLTIKGNLNLLHKKQLTEDLFRNWVRGALGLKYLKLGLERFADNSVKSHHVEIMMGPPPLGNACTTCTADVLLPSHQKVHCPNKSKCLCSKKPKLRKLCINAGFCSIFYDRILSDHRFNDPLLANTDVPNWSIDPWSVATCYISTTGYKGKMSAKEVDCSGLLSLFINNKFIHRTLGDVDINGETDLFKQARDKRNDILHNANYELSEGQLKDYIDLFKSVLEIKDVNGYSPLGKQPGVQEAIDNLNELRNYQIDVHMSKDLQMQMKDLKEHAMSELEEKIKEAELQNRNKLEQITKELKETERNLQLMRDLRSSEAKSKDSKVPFKLKLHIQALGPTGETSTEGNQRIYQCMKDDVANHHSKTYTTSVNSTDQSIHRLLDFIIIIKDCEITSVKETDTYAYIKIHCRTCEAINDVLKIIDDRDFKKETVEIRKHLEKQDHIKTDDVIVSCSSESIDSTKKRLYKRVPTNDFSCGKHQGTQCTWYCSDHDIFFCSACKDSDHSACDGIKQVVSEWSYGVQKQNLTFKRKIEEFKNVQIKDSPQMAAWQSG